MAAPLSTSGEGQGVRYKFNGGTELNESFDVYYYETPFRNYDAQIGRFTGVDALAGKNINQSPYAFANNDPIYYNDPTGLDAALDWVMGSPHDGQQMPGAVGMTPNGPPIDGGGGINDYGGNGGGGNLYDFFVTLYNIMPNNSSLTISSDWKFDLTYFNGTCGGAWDVSNQWDEGFINEYRQFASTIAKDLEGSGEKFTCEDFALNLLMLFSAANGLPLSIKNGSNPEGYKPQDFNSLADYYRTVASTTGANDLGNPKYQNTIRLDGYSSADAGDLILFSNEKGEVGHTQVITNITPNAIYIAQGNFPDLAGRIACYLSDPFHTEDPFSIGYKGVPVQIGYYSIANGNYHNISLSETIPSLLFLSGTSFYQWNFYGFNH